MRLSGHPRWRVRLANMTLVLAGFAWVLGIMAGELHELRVFHTRCAEHGEIVEIPVAHSNARPLDRAGVHQGAPEAPHDHGCALSGIAHWAMPAGLRNALVESDLVSVQPTLPPTTAPRGPPLAYAPKTSPPAIA